MKQLNNKFKKLSVISYLRLQNFMLRSVQLLLFRKLQKDKIQKILIFRTGSIGDNICAFPALSVIRNNFPDAKIDILTNAGSENMVSVEKLIDTSKFNRIINYFPMSKTKLFSQLYRSNYDLFIELPQSKTSFLRELKNQLIVRSLGIRYAFGWKISRTMIFPKWQEKYTFFSNERDRLIKILADNRLNITNPGFLLGIDENIIVKVKSELNSRNIIHKSMNIGVAIGANLVRKKWPLENFKKITEYFTDKEYNILIFGGGEDSGNADKLLINNKVFNFCGELLPLESAEAMKYCSVVISNDSGPLHMAYAVRTPVVAIFSSRDFPGEWDPPNDGVNKVFRTAGVQCSICFNKPCSDNICMQEISPQQVIIATEQILNIG